MKNDNLFTGLEAREKLIIGIRKCALAVGSTMGSSGSNSILECIEMPGYLATNDGISILRAIKLSDPIEDMGRRILLDAVERANKQSGDGSSTATVLTHAIIELGNKYIDQFDPMDIKRSLDDCFKVIEDSINKQKREITIDDVSKVATISSEDPKIGKMIQDIYQKIGKEGVINWDISKTAEDSYSIGQGIHIEGAGFASPYMCDIDEKTGSFLNQARWKDPKILIVKQKITSANDLSAMAKALNDRDIKELVVFCDEVEAPVISDLLLTRGKIGFKILLVKMPLLWKDQWYEDLALASGAKVIDPAFGLSLKNAKLEHLGEFDNITVGKEDVSVDGLKDLTDHINKLNEGDDDSKLRASRLNTKTARYFVGAASESALSYRRLKVEDAISAGWQALHGGIVVGGGIAMLNASKELPDTVGGKILKEALKAPLKQILKNARIKEQDIDLCGGTKGFDTRSKKLVDMFESDIINPANVEMNAARNAISVAATALTANTITVMPKPEMPPMPFPMQ